MAFILLFASIPNAHGIIEEPGKVMCLHAEGYEHMHSAYNTIWIAVYFTLPALTLICFNIAIMVRLRKIKHIYKTLAGQHAALSMYGISQWSSNPPTGTLSTSEGDDEISSVGYTIDNNDFTTMSTITLSQPSPEVKSGKRATGENITLPLGVK